MKRHNLSETELASMSPKDFRSLVRRGLHRGSTHLACRGYVQANLVVLPKEMAFEFLLFCQRNPRPCPVLDVTEPGNPHPMFAGADADLRTDLPKYRVFRDGKIVDEPSDIKEYWRDDLVAFLIGGSYSFDWSLRAAKVPFRFTGVHTTNIPCIPAGRFHGPLTVTGRIFKNSSDAVRAVQISSRHLEGHGPPVHIGDPSLIGIKDITQADIFSLDPIAPLAAGEVIMFWGCGVTPQVVALHSKVPFMITHYPSHVFVSDLLAEQLASI